MKKKNREALREALLDFQTERRLFLGQVRILMEMDCCCCEARYDELQKKRDPSAGQDWEYKMDILEETVERVLEDER